MFFQETTSKLQNWFVEHVEGKASKWWLSLISFAESSFFPIPVDPFLMAVLLVKRQCWIWYSFLVTVTSVLGGVFGYLIGFAFFAAVGEPLVNFYHLEDELVLVQDLFRENTFWAIFTAAFTPVPYKIFTIAAGLFEVNLFIFIIASLLGRGIRFFIVGYLMNVFGEKIGKLVFKYFNAVSLVIVVLIVIYLAIKFLI